MDLTKPVCIECGDFVHLGWQLYCDRCYRGFKYVSGSDVPVKVRSLAKDSEGRLVCFDKCGGRFVLHGSCWVRRG